VTGAARKSRAPETDQDDEITIERRVRVPPDAEYLAGPVTTRMTKVDERLLAIARGELEPDDPFGGLIPIYDDLEHEVVVPHEPDWLVLTPEPREEPSLFANIVPRVCLRPDELFSLPLDEHCSLFVSQVDGRRTLEEIIDACGLDELSGLEAVDDLLRHGAIVLV
jgi:hypothetical protein